MAEQTSKLCGNGGAEWQWRSKVAMAELVSKSMAVAEQSGVGGAN